MRSNEAVLWDSFKELVGAVALQAVNDWIALDYGRVEAIVNLGQTIRRSEVNAFLTSPEFESFLLHVCRGISLEAVRQQLFIKKGEPMTGIKDLTEDERKTIVLMADNGMNVSKVAQACFYSRVTIYERLLRIKAKTGIDPQDFWGLHILLSMLETEKEKSREQERKNEKE